MRLIFWLSLGGALVAVALAFVALIHVPISKHSTDEALASLERYVVNRDQLTPDRVALLNRSVATVKSNTLTLTTVLDDLRRLAVSGFLALAAINLAVAAFAFLSLRESKLAAPSQRER